MRRIGNGNGSPSVDGGGERDPAAAPRTTSSPPPSPPSSGPASDAAGAMSQQPAARPGPAEISYRMPSGTLTQRIDMVAVPAAPTPADPQEAAELDALRQTLQAIATLCDQAELPDASLNLRNGLAALKEVLSVVDLGRLNQQVKERKIDLGEILKQFRKCVALGRDPAAQDHILQSIQIAMQLVLQDLVGMVGLGAQDCPSSRDVQPSVTSAIRWAFKVTLPGDDADGNRLERVMAYVNARLDKLPADWAGKPEFAEALKIVSDVSKVRWDHTSDEAWISLAVVKHSLDALLQRLDQAGILSREEIARLSELPSGRVPEADTTALAKEEEDLVRDGVSDLLPQLERAINALAKPSDLIRGLCEFLRGFNLDRLKMNLRKFGHELGTVFGAFEKALRHAQKSLEGAPPEAVAKAADRLQKASGQLSEALQAVLGASWEAQGGGPADQPLGMSTGRLIGAMDLALWAIKDDAHIHQPDMTALLRLFAASLDRDLDGARRRLLGLGGRDLGSSAQKLEQAVEKLVSAKEIALAQGDEPASDVTRDVLRAVRTLVDDLVAAGVMDPLDGLNFGFEGWVPETPNFKLGPAVIRTMDQLDVLLDRTNRALGDADFSMVILRIQKALDIAQLDLRRLNRAVRMHGGDLAAMFAELHAAVERLEAPGPDDVGANLEVDIVTAIMRIGRAFVDAGIIPALEAAAIWRLLTSHQWNGGLDRRNFF